MWGLAE